MRISEIYTKSIYDNLKPLYANWDPRKPVQLGDFGVMRDCTFIYLGNISQFSKDFPQLKFTERSSPTTDHKSFSSKGTTEVKFNAKGSVSVGGVVNVKPTLEVNFSSEESTFFNAAECQYSMIADKVSLSNTIMDMYHKRDGEKRKWEREWAVVTDLVKAGSTTIAISGGSSASIVFETTGDVESINLADASIGLSIKHSTNIGYQVVAEQGLVPLIGLCKIQSLFLWEGAEFSPLVRFYGSSERIIDALENSSLIQTEESEHAVFFGQLK